MLIMEGDAKSNVKINLWVRDCWELVKQKMKSIILKNPMKCPSWICLEAIKSLLAAHVFSQLSRWAVMALEMVLATLMDAAVNFRTCLEWLMAGRRLKSCSGSALRWQGDQQRHPSRSKTMSYANCESWLNSFSTQGQMSLGDGHSPLASLNTIKETLPWTLCLKCLQKLYGSLVQAIVPFYSDTYWV